APYWRGQAPAKPRARRGPGGSYSRARTRSWSSALTEGKAIDYSQLGPSRTAAPGEWQREAPRSAMTRTLIRAIHRKPADAHNVEPAINQGTRHGPVVPIPDRLAHPASPMAGPDRSEERRVGKEWRSGWTRRR